MSPGLANKHRWGPSCDLEALHRRAAMLVQIRAFFHDHGVLEVETPLLGTTIGSEPQIDFFPVRDGSRTLYLQTSPEFAMKRLLAAGSGDIYQICKAFRRGEAGRFHNPEFTLLEWYRCGFDLSLLMDEVACLLTDLLGQRVQGERRFTYDELFHLHLAISWDAPLAQLVQRAAALDLGEAAAICGEDRRLWLDFLFSHRIQPRLPWGQVVFVHDYPAPLAALARLKPDQPRLAERFEVFVNGVELGNGYRELTDPMEQVARFESEQALRKQAGLPVPPMDRRFLAALQAGLPECSGVALGLDRILMLMLGRETIAGVLAFPL